MSTKSIKKVLNSEQNFLEKSIEETYVKLSPIEHVLKKPGMYVGDLDFRQEKQFIYHNDKIIQNIIEWSPGLYKIVDELIVNAYDQSIRDSTLKNIKCDINSKSFTIFNDGIGIDVEKHPVHKIYVPELIFANLLTSTNYDDSEQRITGGTHGLGAKLSAIFSTKFIVEVWDSKRKKYYKQEFENNLSKISKPEINSFDSYKINIKGGVKITMFPDFNKFKCNGFSTDMINLISRRVIDLICLTNKSINIYLNNQIIKRHDDFESYLSLYSSEQKWIIGKCVKNTNWVFAIRFNDTKSIDPGVHISWVNGINTNKGGKHIDYIIDLLLEKFQKIIGPDFNKKLLNDYVTICLKTSVINPTFNSQTKEELNTPISKFGFECLISDSFWDEIKSSEIISQLKQVLSLSNQKILAKLDGTKKSKIKNIPKLEDANFAGTRKSTDCTLILTEGDSAKATAISGISAIKDGRNIFGVYPLRGKLLNVREASTSQINSNQEIIDIKKILGLKSGYAYNMSNINELRYGSILIMTDADEDGSHIKGLIINFFDYFFPSLLEIKGFLKILVTPLVKATKATTQIDFANLRQYNIWKSSNDLNGWKIKYYKGLGTSTAKEAAEYFTNLDKNTIMLVDTQKSGSNPDILLAFAKEKVNDRKMWLSKYDPENILQLEPPTTISVKQFVHQELVHFSNYDNIRSIPMLIDGFKPSQRKVMYACLKKNLISEAKVAQLAAYVAEVSGYHHGEQSLVSTIIGMAQNFIGSNNINLLVPQGQFGTRLMGGKDHSSARYIYTYLDQIINKIFSKIDNELLTYLDDDGYLIEPKYYVPIIPLILINGTEGIGTGFSTYVPNFNPKDIISWLMNKLTGKNNTVEFIPWYNGFKGTISKYDSNTWISSGVIELNVSKTELTITELPLKYWTNDYKEFLEELIYGENKKDSLFRSYTNLSSDQEIKFILKYDQDNSDKINSMFNQKDTDGLNLLYKYLKLYKTIKQSNMNLYTVDYQIKTYNDIKDILEEYYTTRLDYYSKRKDLLISKLNLDINFYQNQISFIKLVLESGGKIFKLEPDKIDEYLKNHKITKHNNSYDYLLEMTFKQLTKNNLEKVENKVKNLNTELNLIKQKTNKTLWLDDLAELNKLIK